MPNCKLRKLPLNLKFLLKIIHKYIILADPASLSLYIYLNLYQLYIINCFVEKIILRLKSHVIAPTGIVTRVNIKPQYTSSCTSSVHLYFIIINIWYQITPPHNSSVQLYHQQLLYREKSFASKITCDRSYWNYHTCPHQTSKYAISYIFSSAILL